MTQNHGSPPQGPVQRGVIGYKRLSPTACLTCHLLKATEVNPKESFGTLEQQEQPTHIFVQHRGQWWWVRNVSCSNPQAAKLPLCKMGKMQSFHCVL